MYQSINITRKQKGV